MAVIKSSLHKLICDVCVGTLIKAKYESTFYNPDPNSHIENTIVYEYLIKKQNNNNKN